MATAQGNVLRMLYPALRAFAIRRGVHYDTAPACRFTVDCQRPLYRISSHARYFSSRSHSGNTPSIEKNNEFKGDFEAQAWNDQLPRQAELHSASSASNYRPPSHVAASDANTAGVNKDSLHVEASTHVEIEDFGDYDQEEEEELEEGVQKIHVPISLERGTAGVFDVEEIVTVLEDQNGVDVQVISVPPEARFVDQMVIVSGKSLRHMRAMASTLQWLYNRKRKKGDRDFRLEGKDCNDWLAMDLGNVAVHIFTPEARQHYDLETLWTQGPEHDDERHYVQDDHVNLSAEELFWLETQMNQTAPEQEEISSSAVAEDSMAEREASSNHSDKYSSSIEVEGSDFPAEHGKVSDVSAGSRT
ncbi:hypothetical protein BaRGS_00001031 [Batillaria attramentaria]|uniref:Mitochondrial assembly of ribosomal large subunit protein 1 n=1 Tax=Batillaria attramentaria TaxID=370345 RepID=A0ABD0M9K0_9CAEN